MAKLIGYTGTGRPPVPIAEWETDTTLIPIIFFLFLAYAAYQDIRTKEVDDYVHIIIAMTAFIGVTLSALPYMLFGAVITALPLLIAAVIKKGCVGGADIKLMAASGLILGAGGGIIALIIGLFSGVVSTYIYRRIKKTDTKTSFPLVPYLATGCMIAYFL
jgi:leader peptidase (prepilin peptidase)/N-methyltransferase